MDASRTHQATDERSLRVRVLIGAIGLMVAATIVLAVQGSFNDAAEVTGPGTVVVQSGDHIATAPIGTPDSFDDVRESLPSKQIEVGGGADRSGSLISPEDAQHRATHQRM